MVFKGGGDAVSSARAVLETGEFDYAWNLQVAPEILSEMEKKGKGKVIAAFGTYVERLMVNFTNPDPALGENRSEYMDGKNPHPFLTDYAVRRALSLAIDRQILVDAGYGQAGVVACNVLSGPEIYRSDANEECKTQNIAEANKILDEGLLWVGSPAKPVRELTTDELAYLQFSADDYVATMEQHKKNT